jgi:hypothetical protein
MHQGPVTPIQEFGDGGALRLQAKSADSLSRGRSPQIAHELPIFHCVERSVPFLLRPLEEFKGATRSGCSKR